MRITSIWLLACLMLTGCAAMPQDDLAEPVVIEDRDYRPVYDAAVATLRDCGFRVDRQDYRFGRVTTQPLDSPTLFEPWRPLNRNAQQTFASTLGHLQRRVNVMLDPIEAREGEFGLLVEVILERQQLPLRRLTGTASRNRFDSLRTVPAEWADRGITAAYAEPIGRDAEMERELTAKILERAEGR